MSTGEHKIHTTGSGRQFKSDFLERFSKSHGLVPLFFYTPVAIYFLISGASGLSAVSKLSWFLTGLVFWTLFEYWMHRTVFHWTGSPKFHYFVHGIHHDYPNDQWRMVMPLGASLVIAVPMWFLIQALLPHAIDAVFYSGFVLGYVWYDTTHYWTHIARPKAKWAIELKRHHMKHHFATPEARFGVSTPLWDHVFRTTGEKSAPETAEAV